MDPNYSIDLPDELDAAISDLSLSLKKQFLLKHLYEHDTWSVEDRCDRKELREELNFSDDKIKRLTEALADAGLITIEEFPSRYYYTLDISDSLPDRQDHHQLSAHSKPPTNGSPSQTPTTAPDAIDDVRESSGCDANPDVGADQRQSPDDAAHSPLTKTHYTTPPEPTLFAMTTIVLTGLLHYLSILSKAVALFSLLLVNIVYIAAFALTLHNITPSQLTATLTSTIS